MVLLLYCIRCHVLRDACASAGAARRRLGSSAADQGPEGGPRSAPERSPRALRERVCPEVRLETPPRIPGRRATASGHRAVPKHEANVGEELRRRDVRARATRQDVDVVPMVEANGNKPISPLSVTAEPRCVSVKELQLGRRS